MEHIFRIFDFNIYNTVSDDGDDSDSVSSGEYKPKIDKNEFTIQIFGINENRETCSIIVEEFKPFFYIKVGDNWNFKLKEEFVSHLRYKMGSYYSCSLINSKLIKRKKLYGFDGGKYYKFIKLEFNNIQALSKVKNIWYTGYKDKNGKEIENTLIKDKKTGKTGYFYKNVYTELYESNIPPLLRFFHLKEISPSGWIAIPKKSTKKITNSKSTHCKYEFITSHKYILPLNNKETRVPFKICSFDIEASSSHGDFPVPIKSYKKLSTDIIECFEKDRVVNEKLSKEQMSDLLKYLIFSAFGFDDLGNNIDIDIDIDIVYPKIKPRKDRISSLIETILTLDKDKILDIIFKQYRKTKTQKFYKKRASDDDEEDQDETSPIYKRVDYFKKSRTVDNIIDALYDKKCERDVKIEVLNNLLDQYFPKLEGDKVTFIGSTFMNYGDSEPNMNHCIVLDTCSKLPMENTFIESYKTEKEVLIAWQKMIQREDPDIIIGYNIFGFDYPFMFHRAEENNCVEAFLQLSRNKHEICGTYKEDTCKYDIESSSITIASGTHDLKYIKMNGRLQVDLYNYYRRESNLTSYKLDYVAGHFIGDTVKDYENVEYEVEDGEIIDETESKATIINTSNLTGLLEGSYIHIEEIGHSVDYYEGGNKFIVTEVDRENKTFTLNTHVNPNMAKRVRWCLAKDDVTPQDIFRLTKGTSDDRAIIAKYCIQDCNLVHYLFKKSDVLTGYIEMSKICSVPIDFLVMRGQGIKLTSYIAKKCREKETLMPVIDKGSQYEAYEGAIVLLPKCDLYLDNPVACVDYASLYPSSMISENLSHDSKVWTKEYDLDGNLIEIVGEQDNDGNFVYDNLPNYEYVDKTYDTYRYIPKVNGVNEKVVCGSKTCRFAQFKEGHAIMPSILKELLGARKATRKKIPGEKDEFMKQVLEQRQLGYKLTANSLYGQCGAKTSTFYEKDIAACTTATGRMLLIYARRIIEETYGNKICYTKEHGPVLSKAEYIYGDSVANYTPVYVKIDGKFDIQTIEGLGEKYGNNNWTICEEEGKQTKEYCELSHLDIETWSDKGWTKLHRIIRHQLASHKKMVRVTTEAGSYVDVTDDHSLLLKNGQEISPNDAKIGDNLLTNSLQTENDLLSAYFRTGDSAMILSSDNSDSDDEDIEHYKKHTSQLNKAKEKLLYTNESFSGKIKTIEPILNYSGYVYDLTTENHHFAAGVGDLIVHNTDSVFFTFNLQTTDGNEIRGKKALEITIELAQEAGELASAFLKGPHDLEYEKTFMPFCLLSKKRYVGMLYELDPNKGKRKEMGIVLKRRDNAPIVKDIYGGIIDILMKEKDIGKSMEFLKACLQDIVDEKVPIEKLIITKSLRAGYKNPKSIAHKVLADRIGEREQGNKPSSGDRIPYVYIHTNTKSKLQGDKIETPTFIIKNKLKIDYSFYITNQIMKPLLQVYALVLEKIWKSQKKMGKISNFKREVTKLKNNTEPNKFPEKLEKLKNAEVKKLLFDNYLRKTNNQKQGLRTMDMFYNLKNNTVK
jgi:DNA polymerase elongation subunit (family B)